MAGTDNDMPKLTRTAVRNFVDPVVAMLLKNGVTYKTFMQLCKESYVDVAQKEFGIRGRPTNTVRVSALTGIDRRDVKAIKERLLQAEAIDTTSVHQDRMSRIVRGWHDDPDFKTADGTLADIALETGDLSFKRLSQRYAAGLPLNVILKELINAGCVEVLDNGLLHLIKPYYSPPGLNPEALLRASNVVKDLGDTLFHNLYTANERARETPRIERRVMADVTLANAKAFRSFILDEGQKFIETIAQWLIKHQAAPKDAAKTAADEPEAAGQTPLSPTADTKPPVRVGVGLYAIERKP
jgi:hypothetical protein